MLSFHAFISYFHFMVAAQVVATRSKSDIQYTAKAAQCKNAEHSVKNIFHQHSAVRSTKSDRTWWLVGVYKTKAPDKLIPPWTQAWDAKVPPATKWSTHIECFWDTLTRNIFSITKNNLFSGWHDCCLGYMFFSGSLSCQPKSYQHLNAHNMAIEVSSSHTAWNMFLLRQQWSFHIQGQWFRCS